jgi:glucose/arabinose dehydrogenase/mono/diheme cytochrome c family protein
MNNRKIICVAFLAVTSIFWSFKNKTAPDKQDPWVAPAWTDGLKSTFKSNATTLSGGKELYSTYCASCHGTEGRGDGALGAELPVKPANFHAEMVKNQKDGNIFWKLAEGRGAMPSFKTTLSDEKRWQLITYIRSMTGGTPAPKPKNENLLPAGNFSIDPKISSRYIPVPSKVLNAVKSEEQIFMVDTAIKGLKRPWSMTFLPNNSMLITERAGNLRIVKNGKLQEASVGGNVPKGLRDVKLHPQFAKNGLIYLSYYIEPVKPDGGYTVLMRGRLDGDKLVDEKVLYKAGPFKEGGETFGSRIAFDKFGYLYFTVGQRTIDDRHRWKTVQDRSNPSGKVMRFKDDGSIPSDNPFVGVAGVLPEIYTYGHRQPQGLIRHPVTGEIWESEHGEMGGSELNLLKSGGDYGWPDVTYSRNYDGTFITQDTVREGMISPVNHWTPSIAPSDFDFVYGTMYPGWNDNVFIGAMVQKRLARTSFKNGKAVHNEMLLDDIGRIRDVKVGPDKFLYLMVEDTGDIVRLIPLKKK